MTSFASGNSDAAPRDIRMRGFGSTMALSEAVKLLTARVSPLAAETVGLDEAFGRVLGEEVTAPSHVPPFPRSAMDGYAVRAADTFGATTLDPRELRLSATSMPGREPDGEVNAGEACRIMTGAPMPAGADAVLMAEVAEEHDGPDGRVVLVHEAVPPGKNAAKRGEDIESGQVVMEKGRKLRASDLGVLASIRHTSVEVYRRPRVKLFSSGHELVDPFGDEPLTPGKIFDSNSTHMEALVRGEGATVEMGGILPDRREVIHEALAQAASEVDVVITSGAASVGQEDWMPLVVRDLGDLWVHGVSIRPAHPVGFGRLSGGSLVFLMPGNPVAVFVGFWAFVRPALRLLQGRGRADLGPDRTCRLPLRRKLASRPGRVDFVRVRVVDGEVEVVRLGGAGVLTTLTQSDGMVVVPHEREGIEAGEVVEVILF